MDPFRPKIGGSNGKNQNGNKQSETQENKGKDVINGVDTTKQNILQ